MDRRKSPRLEIQLIVRFMIRRHGDQFLTGKTLNMSRSGVLVEFAGEVSVEPGDLVEMEMDLAETTPGIRRCLYCTGTVVRTDIQPAHHRFAIGIAEMHFREARVADELRQEDRIATLVM